MSQILYLQADNNIKVTNLSDGDTGDFLNSETVTYAIKNEAGTTITGATGTLGRAFARICEQRAPRCCVTYPSLPASLLPHHDRPRHISTLTGRLTTASSFTGLHNV